MPGWRVRPQSPGSGISLGKGLPPVHNSHARLCQEDTVGAGKDRGVEGACVLELGDGGLHLAPHAVESTGSQEETQPYPVRTHGD